MPGPEHSPSAATRCHTSVAYWHISCGKGNEIRSWTRMAEAVMLANGEALTCGFTATLTQGNPATISNQHPGNSLGGLIKCLE